MTEGMRAVAETVVPCKCCRTPAALCGVVDFHKSCAEIRQTFLRLSGVPVYYHHCPKCGFIFTVAFDSFTREDFSRHIYNQQYVVVDPDYVSARPESNAKLVARSFPEAKALRVLDYGGGMGLLAERMRAEGFANVVTYDPFVSEHAARPEGQFDLVVSFEVAEHSPDPRGTFADLASFVASPGLVLFSTFVQPADVQKLGVHWWYVAPRNGHVSIFTREAVAAVLPTGMKFASANDNYHVVFRELPSFAAHLLKAGG